MKVCMWPSGGGVQSLSAVCILTQIMCVSVWTHLVLYHYQSDIWSGPETEQENIQIISNYSNCYFTFVVIKKQLIADKNTLYLSGS